MTRPARFRLTRLAILGFVACVTAAMIAYPGGTRADPSAHGYSFLHSPLSALGATVDGNGGSNAVSALLFMIGVTLAGAALVLFFATLLPLYAASPSARVWLARVGCVAGVLAGLGYVGVAWLPVNLHPALHGLSAKTAFRAFLAASLLLGVAAAWKPPVASLRAVVGWFSFACLLAAFILIGIFAPAGIMRVVAQKVIVLSTVVIIAFESYEAERIIRERHDT